MPSVTEVLDYFKDPYLIAWLVRMGPVKSKEISDNAMKIGTIVDQYIQDNIKLGQYTIKIEAVPLGVINCMKAWSKFRIDHPDWTKDVVSLQTELKYNDLIGHPDIINKSEICDIKTASAVRKDHRIQVSTYVLMYNVGIKIGSILRLDKKSGEYEYVLMDQDEMEFWQKRFWNRYQIFKEERDYNEMHRDKLEEAILDGFTT